MQTFVFNAISAAHQRRVSRKFPEAKFHEILHAYLKSLGAQVQRWLSVHSVNIVQLVRISGFQLEVGGILSRWRLLCSGRVLAVMLCAHTRKTYTTSPRFVYYNNRFFHHTIMIANDAG